jgi:hypothetical protein
MNPWLAAGIVVGSFLSFVGPIIWAWIRGERASS